MRYEVSENRTTEVIQEEAIQLKQPTLYQVFIQNDDFTPMEFVVQVLEKFFYMERWKATRVMLEAHTIGKGVCGLFSKDVAESKIWEVAEYTRKHEHPLICGMEIA